MRATGRKAPCSVLLPARRQPAEPWIFRTMNMILENRFRQRLRAISRWGFALLFAVSVSLLSHPIPAAAEGGAAAAGQGASAPVTPIFDLEEHRGHVVYVDFWASWCQPCRKSFPWLEKMHERYADQGLDVVAINLDKERRKATAFLEKFPASFEVRYDPQGLAAQAFGVEAMPSAFLFDREGKQVATYQGFHEKESAAVEATVAKLLAQAAGKERE